MTNLENLRERAEPASRLMKAFANKDRLLILCYLAEGERQVSELEALVQIKQPSLSQQLGRLRMEHLVSTRRSGKEIYYRLASSEAGAVVKLIHQLFCASSQESG